jgi:hypothetical protein
MFSKWIEKLVKVKNYASMNQTPAPQKPSKPKRSFLKQKKHQCKLRRFFTTCKFSVKAWSRKLRKKLVSKLSKLSILKKKSKKNTTNDKKKKTTSKEEEEEDSFQEFENQPVEDFNFGAKENTDEVQRSYSLQLQEEDITVEMAECPVSWRDCGDQNGDSIGDSIGDAMLTMLPTNLKEVCR